MNIILFGDNQNLEYFIKTLKQEGHKIVLVNSDYTFCSKMADKYEINAVCEDQISELVFKEAGVDKADMVVSLFKDDADNLITCEIAKIIFNVKTTYALANNPDNIDLFNILGIDKSMSILTVLKQLINQTSIELDIQKYFSVKSKNYVVREVHVQKKSECLNMKLWDLNLPNACNIISIFRNDDIIIPQGNTQFLAGDKALIAASSEVINEVLKKFNTKERQIVIT